VARTPKPKEEELQKKQTQTKREEVSGEEKYNDMDQ
jgi:hypothetical protein